VGIIAPVKTFVVRLFVPSDVELHAPAELRGVVEEVGSGRRSSFGGSCELVAFLSDGEASAQRPEEAREVPPAPTEGGAS
jgi:hypothetical protein